MNTNKMEEIIDELGYETVRIITIGNSNPTLQIMIDKLDGTNINVDDCAKVSRTLTRYFEENQLPEFDYTLEVSSPGIDRPLTKLAHFARFVGFEAKIESTETIEDRKRFKGKLLSTNDKNVVIDVDGKEYTIEFASINKAKLVLTDELLATLNPNEQEEE
ncbi:MAG: ribosome maturation factor RimP [Alphaproteobacteria bacterium]